jgi:hypothetical protein
MSPKIATSILSKSNRIAVQDRSAERGDAKRARLLRELRAAGDSVRPRVLADLERGFRASYRLRMKN